MRTRRWRRAQRRRILRKRLFWVEDNPYYLDEPARVLKVHPCSCGCSKSRGVCKWYKMSSERKKRRRKNKSLDYHLI